MASAYVRPELRLVHDVADEAAQDWVWFCGHCAAPPAANEVPGPSARVCRACGLGLLLETPRGAAPNEGDAFIVVDCAIRVQAMSAAAERLLAITEDIALNRPVTELLIPGDAELAAPASFAGAIAAAFADSDPVGSCVRPWNTFGVRMQARIAACGPPRAALIVLDSTRRPVRLVNR
jgi:PAS domain-containing protein